MVYRIPIKRRRLKINRVRLDWNDGFR